MEDFIKQYLFAAFLTFLFMWGYALGLGDKVPNTNDFKRTLAAAIIALLFPLALAYKIILQLRSKR